VQVGIQGLTMTWSNLSNPCQHLSLALAALGKKFFLFDALCVWINFSGLQMYYSALN